MYAREIEGTEYSFGVSGKLSRNVLLMYDRQTDSLWSQLIGEAISGEMAGTKLQFLPSIMTTWEDWKANHPETVALEKGYAGSRDSYDSYYASSRAGVLGEVQLDDRLPTKEFVVGVELVDSSIAYPFSKLSVEPILNDEVNGQPLLVLFDPESTASVVYERAVGEQILTFEADSDGQIMDSETGTVWDRFTGVGLEGELTGEQLSRVKSTTVFWFGWKDFHPDTLVYGLTE